MIAIVHTNDGHSKFARESGCAGYSGVAGVVEECRRRFGADNVCLVDCGDSLSGGSLGRIGSGADVIDCMNRVGYVAACPGNADFAFGAARFFQLAGQARFPYLSATISRIGDDDSAEVGNPAGESGPADGGARTDAAARADFARAGNGNSAEAGSSCAGTESPFPLPAFHLQQLGSVTVGFVGITTPSLIGAAAPVSFLDARGRAAFDFSQDATGQRLVQAVQSAIDSARAAGAQVVVGLAHLGQKGQAAKWQSHQVVSRLRGLDALLDGHSHEMYRQVALDAQGHEVLIAQAGAYLSHVGVLLVKEEGESPFPESEASAVEEGDASANEGASLVGKADAFAIAKTEPVKTMRAGRTFSSIVVPAAKTPVHEGMEAFLQQRIAPKLEPLAQVVGKTKHPLRVRADDGVSWLVRSGDTNFGNLVADAYLAATKADAVYLPAWSIRCDLPAGPLTVEDLWNALPVEMQLVRRQVTGQAILDMLEFALRLHPHNSAVFPQVAAMEVEFDPSIESPAVLDAQEDLLEFRGPRRVTKVVIGGRLLDPDATYVLGTVDLMGRDGGNGFTMFRGEGRGCLGSAQLVGCTNCQALERFIAKDLAGIVGDAHRNPRGQGRVRACC